MFFCANKHTASTLLGLCKISSSRMLLYFSKTHKAPERIIALRLDINRFYLDSLTTVSTCVVTIKGYKHALIEGGTKEIHPLVPPTYVWAFHQFLLKGYPVR